MIIDTGYGADYPGCGHLTERLRLAGVVPTDVTDVVLTHLHRDHVGGVIAGGRATFPNATYRCHVADWNHFEKRVVPDHASPSPEQLSTLHGRLEPWDSNCSILPGLDVLEAPGHTPGSCVVVLSSQEHRVMILGDVVHCAIQLSEADWSTLFDVDPLLASRTRQKVLRELDEQTEFVGGHFPGLRFGRILEGEGKRRFIVSSLGGAK